MRKGDDVAIDRRAAALRPIDEAGSLVIALAVDAMLRRMEIESGEVVMLRKSRGEELLNPRVAELIRMNKN